MKKLFLLLLLLLPLTVYPQMKGISSGLVKYAGDPYTCNTANKGRMYFSTSLNVARVCNGTSWGSVSTTATSPGGSTTQVQYNLANALAGDSGLTYTGTGATGTLTIGASVKVGLTGKLSFGAGANALKYTDGAGFAFTDDTTSRTATFNAQSLTGNHSYILPNQDGTICTTGGVCTGYQASLAFGTGVQTALGVNIGSAGAPVLFNGAGGTPSAITLTNAAGLPDSALSANVPLLNAANTFTGNQLVSGSSFGLAGTISGAGIFGTSGIRYKNVASTLTDTTSSGTVATNYTNVFGNNTLAATNATVITNAFNTYISDPVAGSNVTITNKRALGADSLQVGTSNPLTVSNAGALAVAGTSSLVGNVTVSSGATTSAQTDLLINPTTKASGLLFDAQVNGSSKFSVNNAGNILINASAYITTNSFQIRVSSGGAFRNTADGVFGWPASGEGANTLDTTIFRSSAGVTGFGTTGTTANGSWLATNGTLSGTLVGTPQTLSGAGAVSVTTLSTAFTSTGGAQALTLADGTNGQIKTIVHVSDGGSGVLTPTTKSGYSTITFTNVGDAVTLQFFTTAGWIIIGQNGVTVAP